MFAHSKGRNGNTVKHHATRANRDVITDSNIAKQEYIRSPLNALTNHRTSQPVPAATSNGYPLPNAKHVARHHMFLYVALLTMMRY